MKHPCKKCIVRAACSQSCNEYSRFLDFASEFSTFIAMAISCIIMAPILLRLGFLMDQGQEWASLTALMIWIIGFIISICLQASLDEDHQIGFLGTALFAPFMAICFIFFHLAKPYCKRGGT